MSAPKSGTALVLAPNGSVYVAGGSLDGTIGHKILERFDIREGKWELLPPMLRGRGYTAGCVGSRGSFYVSGGIEHLKLQDGLEIFDFAADKWRQMGMVDNENIGSGSVDGFLLRACHQMINII
jgi:hypothetical protein